MKYATEAVSVPKPPQETLTAINDDILNTLRDSRSCLESILTHVRGSQPAELEQGNAKADRTLLEDARDIRRVARDLAMAVQALGGLL